MVISPTSVAPPLVLVPDILRDEDLFQVACFDQVHDLVYALVVRGQVYLALLKRIVSLSTEKVIFDGDPGLKQLQAIFTLSHCPVDVVNADS